MSTAADRTYTTTVGSQELELPLVALSDELTIALLITVDLGRGLRRDGRARAGRADAPGTSPRSSSRSPPWAFPLAIEASRALGLDDYVILHKTPKIHLGETWAEPVYSITTGQAAAAAHGPGPGRRRARSPGGGGRRRHLDGCLAHRPRCACVRRMDAEPVVIGTLMTEGGGVASARWARTRPWCGRSAACRCSTPTAAGGPRRGLGLTGPPRRLTRPGRAGPSSRSRIGAPDVVGPAVAAPCALARQDRGRRAPPTPMPRKTLKSAP